MNLENVQVGDTLIWNGRYIADSRIVKVTRLTKTQVIVGLDKFRKSDGRSVGGSAWDTISVTIPKEGEIEKIREARLHRKLAYDISDACQINLLRKMSLKQLQRLNTLLETL